MTVPKKYFHDRLVLLLLTADAFFAVVVSIWVLLRLNADKSIVYVVSYRPTNKANVFKHGNSLGILAFIFFAFFQLAFNILLSIKVYGIRRHFSLAILAMTLLLIILALVVSNSLLIVR